MVIKQRAISQEQKQARRQEILDVALQLFQETSFESVSMAQVAKKAGIAKGTVYLYFKTKEALFLALESQIFEAWFDETDAGLKELIALQTPCTIDDVVTKIGLSFERNFTLVRLIAIAHTALEQNADFDTVLMFKQMLRHRILQTSPLLEACLPFLKPNEGLQVFLLAYALVIGLQHMAEPAPVVEKALENPGLDIFKIDFMDALLNTLNTLLNGIKSKSERKNDHD